MIEVIKNIVSVIIGGVITLAATWWMLRRERELHLREERAKVLGELQAATSDLDAAASQVHNHNLSGEYERPLEDRHNLPADIRLTLRSARNAYVGAWAKVEKPSLRKVASDPLKSLLHAFWQAHNDLVKSGDLEAGIERLAKLRALSERLLSVLGASIGKYLSKCAADWPPSPLQDAKMWADIYEGGGSMREIPKS